MCACRGEADLAFSVRSQFLTRLEHAHIQKNSLVVAEIAQKPNAHIVCLVTERTRRRDFCSSAGWLNKREARMSKLAAGVLFCSFILISFSAYAFDLNGAWTTNPENCSKVFERKNNDISFTHNSDVFGSGFIVKGDQVRGPAKTCKITNRKEEGSVLHLIASCTTDIAVLGTQEVSAKINDDNRLTRIYPSFPEMGIPFFRCRL